MLRYGEKNNSDVFLHPTSLPHLYFNIHDDNAFMTKAETFSTFQTLEGIV